MNRWKCGWCSSGNHQRCRGAARNQGALLHCACACSPHERCLDCGATEQVRDWACVDPGDCADTLAARSAANPIRKELEAVRLLGGEARRRVLMERTRRLVMSAVDECGIDRVLDLTEPEPARRARPTGRTAGQCLCCGGPTKGGRFQPGHDARYKGRLRREALTGSTPAVVRLRELGWPVPEGALVEPVLALAG